MGGWGCVGGFSGGPGWVFGLGVGWGGVGVGWGARGSWPVKGGCSGFWGKVNAAEKPVGPGRGCCRREISKEPARPRPDCVVQLIIDGLRGLKS